MLCYHSKISSAVSLLLVVSAKYFLLFASDFRLRLLPFMTTIINGSITTGQTPKAFKRARVFPILKKPILDPSDISNFQLVSLLFFLSIILEHTFYNQLCQCHFRILTSLVSKWHIPQRLLFWSSLSWKIGQPVISPHPSWP